MDKNGRRNFLRASAALALTSSPIRAAFPQQDKFDLLIKNADVLDPSQNLRGRRDIGIRFGRIEALEREIAAERGVRVLDAGGRLTTPGLIDLHAHVYP